MLEFFNIILQCFQKVVHAFFNDLMFDNGIPIGWILLTISIFGIIIRFLFGRIK